MVEHRYRAWVILLFVHGLIPDPAACCKNRAGCKHILSCGAAGFDGPGAAASCAYHRAWHTACLMIEAKLAVPGAFPAPSHSDRQARGSQLPFWAFRPERAE